MGRAENMQLGIAGVPEQGLRQRHIGIVKAIQEQQDFCQALM